MSLHRLLPIFLFLAGALHLPATETETLETSHVSARMVSSVESVEPGKPFTVGLLLQHDEGWHTYWKSTATGYATSIDWDLPEGFSASAIQWPTPIIYDFMGTIEYVYEDRILLPVTITPPDSLPGDSVTLPFTADWLMCEDTCVPGSVSAELVLPVNRSGSPSQSSSWASLFRETEDTQPTGPEPYQLEAWSDARTVHLAVIGDQLPDQLVFFDATATLQPHEQADLSRPEDSTLLLKLPLDKAADSPPDRLTGVLRAADGWPALDQRPGLQVDLPISDQPPAKMAAADTTAPGPANLASILGLAFLGGLILNLMPCVFPVLGIKIMGFVSQAGEERAKIVRHGLVFTSGVLVSFWLLAAVLLLLRSGGQELGWGFQLQSPAFVFFLTLFLFAFALNMSGLFEFGQSAVGLGSQLTAKSGYSGSFFSGVLATVVATPCAAPFLAPALGAALALPAFTSFVVFTAIAIGLSTPYLLLSAFPELIRKLPRPGPWMETFKQLMSFLLYATVAYLLWVLAGQLTPQGGFSPYALLHVLFAMVILALGLYAFGRWGAFHRPKPIRFTAYVATASLIAASLLYGLPNPSDETAAASQVQWEEWEPGKATELARSGKTVYVDFTARWCVTCQTNKATVFSSNKVRDFVSDPDVVLLKADWTSQDDRISQALAAFDRSAVPFNLVYHPEDPENPLVLPEILTAGIVLRAFQGQEPVADTDD